MSTTNPVAQPQSNQRKVNIAPKLYVMVFLVISALLAGANPADSKGILNVDVAVVTAAVFDLIIGIFQRRNRLLPDGGIVTGLIVALVLATNVAWYVVAITTVIALLSKHIFKIKRKPFFNPAAFGLLIAFYLFATDQSWWGAYTEMSAWFLLALLVVGFLVTDRVNKFPQVLSFLAVYCAMAAVAGLWGVSTAGDLLRNPLINSALFLAFFMLTDPPTSPATTREQIIFGIITGGVTAGLYLAFGGLSFLLIGILVANGYNAIRLYFASRKLANDLAYRSKI